MGQGGGSCTNSTGGRCGSRADGAGLILPVVVNWLERVHLTALGISFIAAGCGLILCGPAAVFLGFRNPGDGMPSGVRAAVAANSLILAFLALELSDRAVRQDGKLFYWTTFLLLPALVQFIGLVGAQRWSWWAARGTAALGVIWFLGFLVVIPFVPLQADGIPTPWYGRLYMAAVTLVLAGIFAGAFRALGQPETRSYFGVVHPR